MTIRRLGALVLVNTMVFIVLLLIVEGALGYGSAVYYAVTAEQVLASRRYITHDNTLGWVGRPNVVLRDFYGPGRSLTTDARGDRLGIPPPTDGLNGARVGCWGDSFTFGAGVGDTETWCAQLTTFDPAVRTTNRALIGYGLDQAYLAYRDIPTPDTAVSILAFITDDIARMETARYLQNPKPYLSVQDDALVVGGVPVPLHSGTTGRIFSILRERLRTTRMLGRPRATDASIDQMIEPDAGDAELRVMMDKVLQELSRLAAQRQETFLLVYLPTEDEVLVPGKMRMWKEFFRTHADALGMPYLDLHEAFTAPDAPPMGDLFIPEDQDAAGDGSGPGHYTPAGHRLVAAAVYERLLALGALRRRTP